MASAMEVTTQSYDLLKSQWAILDAINASFRDHPFIQCDWGDVRVNESLYMEDDDLTPHEPTVHETLEAKRTRADDGISEEAARRWTMLLSRYHLLDRPLLHVTCLAFCPEEDRLFSVLCYSEYQARLTGTLIPVMVSVITNEQNHGIVWLFVPISPIDWICAIIDTSGQSDKCEDHRELRRQLPVQLQKRWTRWARDVTGVHGGYSLRFVIASRVIQGDHGTCITTSYLLALELAQTSPEPLRVILTERFDQWTRELEEYVTYRFDSLLFDRIAEWINLLDDLFTRAQLSPADELDVQSLVTAWDEKLPALIGERDPTNRPRRITHVVLNRSTSMAQLVHQHRGMILKLLHSPDSYLQLLKVYSQHPTVPAQPVSHRTRRSDLHPVRR